MVQRCNVYPPWPSARIPGVIVDLWSRKIIGWALHEKLNAELSVAALYQALKQRKPKPGLMLHTDRGVEFRAQAMQI